MRTYRAIFQLLRADYLVRIRSSAFFIILAFIVFAGYFYTPAANASYKALSFGVADSNLWYRGVYNSAWIGTQVAIWASIWFLFTGFFLVRNAIERDRTTGVGQIIAATPLTRLSYILGKMLSNMATLLTMLGVVIVATGIMQFLLGEYRVLDLWQLISPFLFMIVPIVALVAALAVLFECVTFLRGTIGSVIYFFLTLILLLISASIDPIKGGGVDPLGIGQAMHLMDTAVRTTIPGFKGDMNLGISPIVTGPKTFVWQGWSWSDDMVVSRLLWLALAFIICIVATLFFTRFDPAKEQTSRKIKQPKNVVDVQDVQEVEEPTSMAPVKLTPLSGHRDGWLSIAGRVLVGELRMLGKEVPWWWYIGALAWIVLGLVLPYDVAYKFFLPLAWLWPLPIWSSLGNRERRLQAHQLIFSSASVLSRQFFMHYLAGVLITLGAASGIFVRVLLMGNSTLAVVVLLGAFFIPALALFAGVWTSGRRFFEMIYLVLWYVGAISQLPPIDFMGVTSEAVTLRVPYIFGGIAALLLILAVIGRSRQIHAQ